MSCLECYVCYVFLCLLLSHSFCCCRLCVCVSDCYLCTYIRCALGQRCYRRRARCFDVRMCGMLCLCLLFACVCLCLTVCFCLTPRAAAGCVCASLIVTSVRSFAAR